MSYKLIEFGGQATVILRAVTDFEVNNVFYKKDDVVFLLRDVNLDFTYNEKYSDTKVGHKNLLFYDERAINNIVIEQASLTSEYLQLFCKKIVEPYYKSNIEKVNFRDKTAYLTKTISTDSIYIIDKGQSRISYDSEYNSITLTDMELEDGEYTIIYKEKLNEDNYDINNSCSIPYLSMEIICEGNIDKERGNCYITVPKVSLLNRPDFTLTNQITIQNLTFKVIHDAIQVTLDD